MGHRRTANDCDYPQNSAPWSLPALAPMLRQHPDRHGWTQPCLGHRQAITACGTRLVASGFRAGGAQAYLLSANGDIVFLEIVVTGSRTQKLSHADVALSNART